MFFLLGFAFTDSDLNFFFSGLVLEFVEGGDLLEYIIKNGGLSESLTRYLTRQLCDALKVRRKPNVWGSYSNERTSLIVYSL